jgi:hypothetical protein
VNKLILLPISILFIGFCYIALTIKVNDGLKINEESLLNATRRAEYTKKDFNNPNRVIDINYHPDLINVIYKTRNGKEYYSSGDGKWIEVPPQGGGQ